MSIGTQSRIGKAAEITATKHYQDLNSNVLGMPLRHYEPKWPRGSEFQWSYIMLQTFNPFTISLPYLKTSLLLMLQPSFLHNGFSMCRFLPCTRFHLLCRCFSLFPSCRMPHRHGEKPGRSSVQNCSNMVAINGLQELWQMELAVAA